jgi:hypothetical protein
VTATINGVFPMPASAWVGKPSRQASGARSRNLPARHSGIARDYLSTAKCPVGPTFPRICPLFETQRKRSIAAARKAADGGMAQDRSQGGPHVPRLCGRTPLRRRGFGRRTRAEALVALLPTRRRVGPMNCCASTRCRSGVTPAAASTTGLGDGRTVRDALQTFRDQTEFPPARGFRSTASAPSVSFSDRAQPNYNKASVSRRSDDAGSPAALTMTPTTCLGGIHLKNRT